jgi:hypothetical protein
MKKALYTALGLFMATAVMTGCDKVPAEQFTKYVLFTRNGFQPFEMSFDSTKSGVYTQPISISVSGTSYSTKDVNVDFEVNDSVLQQYNFDKFRNDSVAYYKILPPNTYSIVSKQVTIKTGSEYATLPIEFNLDMIDKYQDYVLPIMITKTSDYTVGIQGTSATLMNVVIKNSFSGNYSMSGAKLNDGKSELTMNNTLTLKTVAAQKCSFLAGDIAINTPNKNDYLVEVAVNADSTLSLNAVNNKIDLQFTNPSFEKNNFKNVMQVTQTGTNKFTYKLWLNYSYLDFTTGNAAGVRKTFNGLILRDVTVGLNY